MITMLLALQLAAAPLRGLDTNANCVLRFQAVPRAVSYYVASHDRFTGAACAEATYSHPHEDHVDTPVLNDLPAFGLQTRLEDLELLQPQPFGKVVQKQLIGLDDQDIHWRYWKQFSVLLESMPARHSRDSPVHAAPQMARTVGDDPPISVEMRDGPDGVIVGLCGSALVRGLYGKDCAIRNLERITDSYVESSSLPLKDTTI